eukprot:1354468-Amorphochlora_amoeboformis.AAC.1
MAVAGGVDDSRDCSDKFQCGLERRRGRGVKFSDKKGQPTEEKVVYEEKDYKIFHRSGLYKGKKLGLGGKTLPFIVYLPSALIRRALIPSFDCVTMSLDLV